MRLIWQDKNGIYHEFEGAKRINLGNGSMKIYVKKSEIIFLPEEYKIAGFALTLKDLKELEKELKNAK